MKQWALGLLLASLAGALQAEDMNKYDRIAFSVSAEREVENDTVIATLLAAEEGQDNTVLADKVNSAITWGLETAKKVTAIEARTLSYTTSPSYDDKGKIIGWQVRQTMQVKSTDTKAMSTLLGTLQEKLHIEAINYAVSPKVQKSLEDELITEALSNFKRRATLLQGNMERAEYRVVQLNVQTGQQNYAPIAPMMPMSAMISSDAAPPSLEAGKQTLRVDVAAEIELSVK